MTLSQKVQQLILQQIAEGRHYRDISKSLGVAIGSIANVRKQGQIRSVRNTIVATNHAHVGYDNEQSQPPSHQGNEQSGGITQVDLSINEQSSSTEPIINIPDDQEIDFDNMPYHPALDGESGERLLGYIVEPEQGVDISDTQYNPHEKVTQIETEANQNQSRVYSSTRPYQTRPEVEEDSEAEVNKNQSLLVRWVLRQREAQRTKQDSLNIQFQSLKRERSKLEQEKRDLAPLRQVFPMAQSLVGLGLDINIADSWLVSVSQTAQLLGLDSKSAAWKLAEEIQEANLFGGVKKAIEQRMKELEILGIAIENRKEELASTQTQLETTKFEVERNRENLLVLSELLKVGPLDTILAKVREYDSLTRMIDTLRLGQNNNNGQVVVNQPKNNGHSRDLESESYISQLQNDIFGDN